jgi:hypothetical protein
MRLVSVMLGSVLFFLPASTFAAIYYVGKTGSDGNSCATARNSATPKRTIQAGVNCATAAGDVVNVQAGSYTESVSVTSSGASGNPIRIQPNGYTNDGCRTPGCGSGEAVTWSGGASNRALSIDNGNSHIRVQGFTFANTMTSPSAIDPVVIHVQNPNCSGDVSCKNTNPVVGIEILNNTFSSNGNDGTVSQALSYQIGLYYLGHPPSYTGPNVIEVAGNTFSNNFGYGIISGASSDVHIANNVMTSASGSCNNFGFGCSGRLDAGLLTTYGACGPNTCSPPDRLIIEGNTVANVGNTTGESNGIRLDSCKNPTGIIIRRNTIHDLTGSGERYGIFPEAYCSFQSIDNNIIYNIGYVCLQIGSTPTGGPLSGVVEHNTLYQCGRSGIHINSSSGVTYRNNIVATNGDEVIGVANVGSRVVNNTFRNNLYWKAGATLIAHWTSDDPYPYFFSNLTFSQWNSASGETGDKNADPLFVNPSAGDFRLQSGSPAKGAATDGTDMGAIPAPPSQLPPPANLRIANP